MPSHTLILGFEVSYLVFFFVFFHCSFVIQAISSRLENMNVSMNPERVEQVLPMAGINVQGPLANSVVSILTYPMHPYFLHLSESLGLALVPLPSRSQITTSGLKPWSWRSNRRTRWSFSMEAFQNLFLVIFYAQFRKAKNTFI